jgi:hypothetical protein
LLFIIRLKYEHDNLSICYLMIMRLDKKGLVGEHG